MGRPGNHVPEVYIANTVRPKVQPRDPVINPVLGLGDRVGIPGNHVPEVYEVNTRRPLIIRN